MRLIYHLVPRATWEQVSSAPYRADSLQTEGFIHCSNQHQVAWAANRFYAGADDLLVLGLDVARLESSVRDEDPGCGELFPHIYGPINREAVTEIVPLKRGPEGKWIFP